MIKKIIDNFNFDKFLFFNKRLDILEKMKFICQKYYSILFKKKKINYLGKEMRYDNIFTPALLETYPNEIDDLSQIIDMNEVKTVLDIGANVGQWSFTLKSFYPHIRVTSLEPNPNIFNLLEHNSKSFNKWSVLNYGISNKTSKNYLYYSGNGSAEASIYPVINNLQLNKVSIKLLRPTTRNMNKFKLKKNYDLIKIDVEGAELDVLKALNPFNFRYLFIEIALKRSKGVKVEDVFQFFKEKRKCRIKLLAIQKAEPDSPATNALFYFPKTIVGSNFPRKVSNS